MTDAVFQKSHDRRTPRISDEVFQVIKVQLLALNLVTTSPLTTTGGGTALFWSLTQKGHSLMMLVSTVRRNDDSNSS